MTILGFDNDAHYILELENVTGEVLYRFTSNAKSVELPVIGKGIYFLTISLEGGFIRKTFKYVIQ